jgi:hypothetical protein
MFGFQVTGPVGHYISPQAMSAQPSERFPSTSSSGTGAIAYYLGTSRVAPRIHIQRSYAPIMMEEGGYTLPFDLAYQGKIAKILTVLNRFDTRTAYMANSSPRYSSGPFALGEGLDSFMDVGALLLGNRCYFSLYLEYPFSGSINAPNVPQAFVVPGSKFPQAALNIPRWTRFPACMIEYSELVGGTGEREVVLAIHAQRIYYSRSAHKQKFNNSPLAGGYLLYDHMPPGAVQGSNTTTTSTLKKN